MTYAGVGSTSTLPNGSSNVVSAPRTVVGNDTTHPSSTVARPARPTGQWRHWFVIRWILERHVRAVGRAHVSTGSS